MTEDHNKVLSLIGFSKRANKLASGTSECTRMIEKGRGELLIIATDISENTKDKIVSKAESNNIPHICFSTILDLSKITGNENVGVYLVLNKEFSEPIKKYFGLEKNKLKEEF